MKKYRFKGDYIVYYILTVLTIVFGLSFLFCPFMKGILKDSITYLIGIALLLYAGCFLLKNLFRKRVTVVKVFMWIEFVLVVLMALGMFLSQLRVINITECQALGLTIWCRGFVEIVRGYYNQGDIRVAGRHSAFDRAAKYINIFLITFGTYVFFNVNINKDKIVFSLGVCMLVAAAIFLFLAIYCTTQRGKIPVKDHKESKDSLEEKASDEEAKEEKEEKEEEPQDKKKKDKKDKKKKNKE